MANQAKAIKTQLVKLEAEWTASKKKAVRFSMTSEDVELEDAIFAVEKIARDAFMLSPEASK